MNDELISGEPWIIDDDCTTNHECCDCGLEHQMIVNVNTEKKTVTLRFYRDGYATIENRKREGIVLYRRKPK